MRSYLTFCIILLTSALINAQNWNTGSGGNSERNGISLETGPLTEEILWEGGLNAIIAQQAVIDGNVVAMSRIFGLNDVLGGTDIVAQNLKDGSFLWSTSLPIDFPNSDWRNRVSAIRNGHVYATRSGNTNMSYMYALDTLDGSIMWKSADLIDESSTESVSFAENGDLIVGNNRSIIRINKDDGSTIWKTSRTTPTSNGQEVAVHDSIGCYWQPSPFGPTINLIDIETGRLIIESEAITLGIIQQLTPFFGPDGTIYAPRTANNPITDSLVALSFKMDTLVKKWSVPIGYVPFSTSGIGPNGSVYTYSRDGEVISIDQTGSITHRSEVILSGTSPSPRMAIDAAGRIYVTNGEFAEGKFYVFDSELKTLWSTPIRNVNIGGPAIGENGTLVVCGVGTDVRAYKGFPTSVSENNGLIEAQVFPNPVQDYCVIKIPSNPQGQLFFKWYNEDGKLVDSSVGVGTQGEYFFNIESYSRATYNVQIYSNDILIAVGQIVKL